MLNGLTKMNMNGVLSKNMEETGEKLHEMV